MAEIGIIGSLLSIADIGIRLGIRLYTYANTVAQADRNISALSQDITTTSSVLRLLGETLEKGFELNLCSEEAFRTASNAVNGCSNVFQEIEGLLTDGIAMKTNTGEATNRSSAVRQRLTWPFMEPRIQLLSTNLEKLKSTLSLMLQVIILARQISEKLVNTFSSARL